jgi:hypothetical protein
MPTRPPTARTYTARDAYLAGWRRSGTLNRYDLDTEEDRFASRHGGELAQHFADGWLDYASDYEQFSSYKGSVTA